MRDPLTRPEPPIPATARPTINMVEEFAAPHSNEPSSKRQRKENKVYFKTVCVYNLPARGWRAQLIMVLASLFVQLSSKFKERRAILGQEISTAVPSYVVKRMELARDMWDRLWLESIVCAALHCEGSRYQLTVTIMDISRSIKNATKVTEATTSPSLRPVICWDLDSVASRV